MRRVPESVWLCFLAVVLCAAVNPGNFGTVDTELRLQTERWIRLGEPPVSPEWGHAGSGLIGRNGVLHPWYGIGQSLVMLPFDIVAQSAVAPFVQDEARRRQVVVLLIAFLMQSVLTAAVVLLARALLATFGFPPQVATAGAIALLLATTCLSYVQVAQENELLLVLALAALVAIRRWESTGAVKWAAFAGAAAGFAILVRLPSLLEAAGFGIFALASGGNWKKFLAGWMPPILIALAVDRWYQWLRFGEWWSTYTGIVGRQASILHEPGYPFSYPFAKGFFGAFLSPDKSVFLFDPLLALAVVLVVWRWGRLDRRPRTLLVVSATLLLAYDAFYARYFDFGGDVAWGHRFLTLPVFLIALFAVPLLLSSTHALPLAVRRICWAVVVFAIAEQTLSTTMVQAVEVEQRLRGVPHSILWNRVANVVDVVGGKTNTARFTGVPAPWRTFAYLPFQLRFQFPRLAVWAIAGWWILVAMIPVLAVFVLRRESQKPR
jgi:hypothetical protein